MKLKYDFLVVGAGLFGAVFAREMTNRGKKCLVLDKNFHIGGNCYTETVEGVCVHKYGPHIFHTDNLAIWNYVQSFCPFYPYFHRVKAFNQGKIYSFPINLFTLYQLWGVKTPQEAKLKLEEKKIPCSNPNNFEELALSQVGEEIYQTFIKGYTTKQWGCEPKELLPFIFKRLPIRLSFDDGYYQDRYQGIPVGGYTPLFVNLLKGIEVRLNTDYFDHKNRWDQCAHTVVYTGKIDEFFAYRYGKLDYRSLRFENEILPLTDFQGTAVMNYPNQKVLFTRITEYKHFEWKDLNHTVISKEYPDEGCDYKTPYYPVNTEKNNAIYKKYHQEANSTPRVIFGGRLAEFKYYDMHQVIASALDKCQQWQKEKSYV